MGAGCGRLPKNRVEPLPNNDDTEQKTENEHPKNKTQELPMQCLVERDQETKLESEKNDLPMTETQNLPIKMREFAQKIRSKYAHISNRLLRTGEIVAKLFQSKVLTPREKDDIQHHLQSSTPTRATEQLLDSLISKDDQAYTCFIIALIETDQKHIVELLDREDEFLDTEHSMMIQRNYAKLVEILDVDSGLFLDRLYGSGALSDREKETINSKPTRHEKNEALLEFVRKFSDANFEKFLQALEDSNQEHVVTILTGRQYGRTESEATTSTADELNAQNKESGEQETVQKDQNIRRVSKTMETSPFPKRHRSFKTPKGKLAKLPAELLMEISLKEAVLRLKIVLPSWVNVEMFFRRIVQGFVQRRREVKRNHTEIQDMSENFIRENDPNQTNGKEIEDAFKTDICMLQEDLRHLYETLTKIGVELDSEKQKSSGLESKLQQNKNDSEVLLKQKYEHLRELQGQVKILNEELQMLKTENEKLKLELDNEKQMSRGLENQQQENLMHRDELQNELEKQKWLMDEYTKTSESQLKEKDEMLLGLEQELKRKMKEWTEKNQQLTDEKQELERKYSECEEINLNLQNELDHERAEKDRHIKAEQEYRRLLGERRYKSNPELIATIRTKAAERERKDIRGLAILDKELFVVSDKSSEIEVYDSFQKSGVGRQWTLRDLTCPLDMVSCSRNQCLYIFDSESKDILRVDPNGNLVLKWSTGVHKGTLSVTDQSNVILTVLRGKRLCEYSPNGALIREISLDNIMPSEWHLAHSLHLANSDFFLVCHGSSDHQKSEMGGLCMVDINGKLEKSFVGKSGSSANLVYLSVDGSGYVVGADQSNGLILLFDSNLKLKRSLASAKQGLLGPVRILHLLDESTERLIVADNDKNSGGRIFIFDFK